MCQAQPSWKVSNSKQDMYHVYFPISQNFCLFWRKNSAFCMTLSICTIVHHHFSVHLSSLLQAATAVQLLLGSQAFTKGIKLPTFIRLDFKHCVELPPDSQYILGQWALSYSKASSFWFLKKPCIMEVGINPKDPCKIQVKFSKFSRFAYFYWKSAKT